MQFFEKKRGHFIQCRGFTHKYIVTERKKKMKNNKITIIFTAMLIGTITLSACGKVDSLDPINSSSTAEATISSETAETSLSSETATQKTETNTENIISDEETTPTEISEDEPDTKAETVYSNENNNSAIADSSQEYMDTAYELIGALDYIDKIGASNMPFDESAVYTDENGNTFAKVTRTQFSDTSDLREYMESYLTDSFLNDRYSGILGTDDPIYIDIDGMLYGKTDAKGGGFPWTDTPLKIENVTGSSFNILAEYDNYGASETMSIEVVMDDGRWKINWVTFGL